MALDGSDLLALSDHELQSLIQRLELDIAAGEAQIEPPEMRSRRTRKIARGTVVTALGFFGLTLDPISGLLVIVGFYDWIEGLQEDAAATNLRGQLVRRKAHLMERLTLLEKEVRRRGGNITPSAAGA